MLSSPLHASLTLEAFKTLGDRGGMTPSVFTRLAMLMLLPATFVLNKVDSIHADAICELKKGRFGDPKKQNAWLFRQYEEVDPDIDEIFSSRYNALQRQGLLDKYNSIVSTHHLETSSSDICEGLSLVSKVQSSDHKIHFPGNSEDALMLSRIHGVLHANPGLNHFFWNYPGVAGSSGTAACFQDLVDAGYKETKTYIERHPEIKAQDITLHGFSLGGAVAAHVARRLYDENYPVKLVIDRSFASITDVLTSPLEVGQIESASWKHLWLHNVATSILFGVLIGSLPASIIATASIIMTAPIALVTQRLASLVQSTNSKYLQNEKIETIAHHINDFGDIASWLLREAMNYITFILTAALAIAGVLFFGLIFGGIIGGILAYTQDKSKDPVLFPCRPVVALVLYSLCCNVDSTAQIKHIMSAFSKDTDPNNLYISNSTHDQIIRYHASLLRGLGVTVSSDSACTETVTIPKELKGTFVFFRNLTHCESAYPPNPNHLISNVVYL